MLRLALVVLFTVLLSDLAVSEIYPGKKWDVIEEPESVGFSNIMLKQAKRIFERMDSNAFIFVYKGKLLISWGNTDEKLDVFSVRKSFLSSLFGVFSETGQIDLNASLESLGIDEDDKLSATEKSARIIDLLRSRSGVYHPAAYTSFKKIIQRPDRGSYKPGEYWFYNNWDFNVLATIFHQLTGTDIFSAFYNKIALPIGMQDFKISDGRFHKEYLSRYPAYPFRVTARDMARFGLLFARSGRWRGNQIIPEAWIRESTKTHSITSRRNSKSVGYGLMWCTVRPGRRHFKNHLGDDAFSARGNGGQFIIVAPSLDIVAVHTSDWKWTKKKVKAGQVGKLLRAVLNAKISN